MPVRSGAVLFMAAALCGGGLMSAARGNHMAAEAPRTIASGVYTDEQATRGMKAFIRNCSACHGEQFNGAESGPPLIDGLIERWKGKSVADLFEKIRTTMPPLPDTPGKLGDQGYADVTAAILKANGEPAGPAELPSDPAALAAIIMDR
ncbi:MAG: cytochrome c [Sphingobium sp.]